MDIPPNPQHEEFTKELMGHFENVLSQIVKKAPQLTAEQQKKLLMTLVAGACNYVEFFRAPQKRCLNEQGPLAAAVLAVYLEAALFECCNRMQLLNVKEVQE